MTVALEGGGQQHALAVLYSWERPGAHFTEGWSIIILKSYGTTIAYAVRRWSKCHYVAHDSIQHDRQCTYNITLGHIQCGFVALGIQQAKCMRHIVICGPSGSTLFFHIISLTTQFFKNKNLLDIKCMFWFSLQLLSETFLIIRRTERDINTKVYWSLHKYPLFLSNFNETWIFRICIWKILKYQIS